MSWIDDDDKRRQDKLRRDDMLKAKAFLFLDYLAASIKRDVAILKDRYAFDIAVHQPELNEIHIQKKLPYPTFTVIVILDVLSESVRIEWIRTEGRDQQSLQNPPPVRWHLSLDTEDELHVKEGEEDYSADQASERILRSALNP